MPASDHTSPWPAGRTLRSWSLKQLRQEAAISLPGTKDPPAGAAERYRDVLPLPLAGMFAGRAGRPKTIEGGREPDTDAYKGVYQWERHPGSEASAEEEEEEDDQELSADEAG